MSLVKPNKIYIVFTICQGKIYNTWKFGASSDEEFGQMVKQNDNLIRVIGDMYYCTERGEWCGCIGKQIVLSHSNCDDFEFDDIKQIFENCPDKDIRKEICGESGRYEDEYDVTFVSVLVINN